MRILYVLCIQFAMRLDMEQKTKTEQYSKRNSQIHASAIHTFSTKQKIEEAGMSIFLLFGFGKVLELYILFIFVVVFMQSTLSADYVLNGFQTFSR